MDRNRLLPQPKGMMIVEGSLRFEIEMRLIVGDGFAVREMGLLMSCICLWQRGAEK